MLTAAVLGASGYAGGELVRLIDAHPSMEVAFLGAHSHAGSTLGAVHPHLSGPDRMLQPHDVDQLRGPNDKTVDALMRLDLAAGVDVQIKLY